MLEILRLYVDVIYSRGASIMYLKVDASSYNCWYFLFKAHTSYMYTMASIRALSCILYECTMYNVYCIVGQCHAHIRSFDVI